MTFAGVVGLICEHYRSGAERNRQVQAKLDPGHIRDRTLPKRIAEQEALAALLDCLDHDTGPHDSEWWSPECGACNSVKKLAEALGIEVA